MSHVVRKCWLPEVVEVNISEDLVPELRQVQEAVLSDIATLKQQHGIEGSNFRIRDDTLLANKTYAISINGVRVAGGSIDRAANLQSELGGANKRLCSEHAD